MVKRKKEKKGGEERGEKQCKTRVKNEQNLKLKLEKYIYTCIYILPHTKVEGVEDKPCT